MPQSVVEAGNAEFGIAWLPKVLASIEQGADLVNIAQVFQRSGTLQVAWANSGITTPEDWRGKRVGTWGYGNEHELFAAMRKVGIDPENASDVTIVSQDFSMDALLNNDLDAAQAMIYNEYAQVLERINEETGELYTPDDLSVISMESAGTAMLQDGIFASSEWLSQAGNEDIATRFLRASFKGWIWCRDNFDACVQIVLDNGPTLGQGHQTWQLNEINALIWPSPAGIGTMDAAAFDRTVQVALEGEIITADPPDTVYRTDLAAAARQGLEGDVNGAGGGREENRYPMQWESCSGEMLAHYRLLARLRRDVAALSSPAIRFHRAQGSILSWFRGEPGTGEALAVFNAGAAAGTIALPGGSWTDAVSGEIVSGNAAVPGIGWRYLRRMP